MKERDARMCEARKRRHKEPAENEKEPLIVFCQYNGKLFSYIADTHFQMWQAKNLPQH